MGYTFQRRIARGGMGVVDLAVDDEGREVACKRLVLAGTAEELAAARTRLAREADLLAQLHHEAIVPLLDVLDDDGDLVLVMPHLAGGDLGARVRRDGPLPADEVRGIGASLLGALAAAHRQGVLHRDVKPGNVLFDDVGRAHLADFGVATSREATAGLTRPGTVLGTPGFLAPEQARDEPLTPAADVAGLGATLHFAATGRSPWGEGEPAAVLARAARGRAVLDPTLPRDLRDLLGRMLDARPERRPTAAELAGGPDGTVALPAATPRRRRALATIGVAAGLTVALGLGIAVAGGDDGGSEAASTTSVPETSTSTVPPCEPLPYQPCGGLPAPFTDGTACTDDHADYDGDAANGCEAAPDDLDGSELVDVLRPNLVPAADVDRFVVRIDDGANLLCDGTFRLTVTAPAGTSVQAVLFDDDGVEVARTTSTDGEPATIERRDPRCLRDDGADFAVEVTAVGDARSAEPYVLARRGSF